MDKEKEKIIKIVRSLIISSNPKDGMNLNKLLVDFKNYEGTALPLFEHRTVVEFLHASGEFYIESRGSGVFTIYALTTAKSSHVSKLVHETNRARDRRSMRPPPPRIPFSAQNRLSLSRTINNNYFGSINGERGGIAQQQNIGKLQPLHQRTGVSTKEFSFEQLKLEMKEDIDEQQQKEASSVNVTRNSAFTDDNDNDVPSIEESQNDGKSDETDQLSAISEQSSLTQTIEAENEIVNNVPSDIADVFAVVCTDDDDCIEFQQMDKLDLPWQDEYWSVLITCCTSTTEVWGKLHGRHCRFDPSAIEFQDDVLANSKIATVFNVDHIYLTIKRGLSHRIRLDNVDYSTNQILCFFVDRGDKKWVDMLEIYNCSSVSMNYPPQAIRFELDGLEGLPITNVRKCLEKTLLNRSVTGQIVTREEDFISSNESNDTEAVIKAAFYDTSNGSFVFLHREIVKDMYEDIAAPELTTSNLTPVTISHIADNGDIFCQLQPNNVHYVNKLIKEFIRQNSSNPFLPTKKTVSISSKNTFVAYDQETNKLYRGRVLSETEGGVKVFFIDYGQVKIVPASMMYHVENPHDEISKFPPQAIRIKLSGVGRNAVESLVSRLRNRFSLNRKAYVKAMHNDTIVPEVKLYFDADSYMVCVNDSIELEIERNQILATNDGTTSKHDLDVIPEACPQSKSSNFWFEYRNESQASCRSIVTRPTIETFQPPKLNSRFEIVIVQSESPSNFVIKPVAYMSQWQTQMKALQIYCKTTQVTVPLDMIKEVEPYACLKSNGYWYRAFIKFHRSKMYAFFCDIADIDITDVNKVKFLPMEYRIIPKLAMNARLFNIEPVNGTWELDDKVQFSRITKGKKFDAIVAKVMYNEKKHDNSMLEITLEYKSHVINDLFVQSERAVFGSKA